MEADYVHKDTLTATDYVELNKNNELLMSYNQELLKENQSLKKQLEELEEENFNLRENIYIEKMSFSSEGRNIEELIEMPTYEDLLKQQKEFIEYLESEINKWHHNYDSYNYEYEIEEPTAEELLQTSLSKYKEIIGKENDSTK